MTDPLHQKSSPWGAFNPLSPEFREADRIFHVELFDHPWRRAAIIFTSIIGAFFFIVGAFPAFCWMVQALRPGDSKNADAVNGAARPFFQPKTSEQVPAASVERIQRHRGFPPREILCVKGPRWRNDYFKGFLKEFEKKGVHFRVVDKDPGENQHLILFEYWGKSGGDLDGDQYKKPFGANLQSKLSCIVAISDPDKEELPGGITFIKYDPDSPLNPYDDYIKVLKTVLEM